MRRIALAITAALWVVPASSAVCPPEMRRAWIDQDSGEYVTLVTGIIPRLHTAEGTVTFTVRENPETGGLVARHPENDRAIPFSFVTPVGEASSDGPSRQRPVLIWGEEAYLPGCR